MLIPNSKHHQRRQLTYVALLGIPRKPQIISECILTRWRESLVKEVTSWRRYREIPPSHNKCVCVVLCLSDDWFMFSIYNLTGAAFVAIILLYSGSLSVLLENPTQNMSFRETGLDLPDLHSRLWYTKLIGFCSVLTIPREAAAALPWL